MASKKRHRTKKPNHTEETIEQKQQEQAEKQRKLETEKQEQKKLRQQKQEWHQKQLTAEKREDRIWKYLSGLSDIASVIVAILAFSLSLTMAKIESRYRPLEYSAERGALVANKVYGETGIPVYYTNFNIVEGRCREFYIIGFDEHYEEYAITGAPLKSRSSKEYTYSGFAQVPEYISTEQEYYDYFFIYTVSSEGVQNLDCFYYLLDLTEYTVTGPYKVSELETISIMNWNSAPYTSKARMLYRYFELMQKVDEIPILSCATTQ
jgi:Membrane protein involved in colicin uptake